ncbi:MAG: DUF5689 domain-containing protein [Bacteroidales bacterium]|nr:DUF5689 domain-containing protein [Bacteroidales bacterium]
MKRNIISLVLISIVILLVGCKKYETPEYKVPHYTGPAANRTIVDIKNAYDSETGKYDSVWVYDGDFVVDAIVVSSDEGGNYYKSLVVQDETGAIEIQVDGSGLYTQYAVGQKVYINCKGLCVDVYGKKVSGTELGIFRLGWIYRDAVGQINTNAISKYISKDGIASPQNLDTLFITSASWPQISATASLLNDPNVSKLVQIQNCQFSPNLVGLPLSEELNSTDRPICMIGDLAVTDLVVRTSNYSKIRGIKIPEGPCTLTGILSKYGKTYQLQLRTLEDFSAE